MEMKRGNQSNIWERRTDVDRQVFRKREGTKEGLEREGITGNYLDQKASPGIKLLNTLFCV
jgi:hypothetical protein